MDRTLTAMVGLIVVAVAVSLAARRFALPYTVGLVVTGVIIAGARVHLGIELTHDVIFQAILPPLLFEAAINLHWKELRRDAVPVLTLALVGTVLSAATIAGGMIVILGWPPSPALLFGALIAATDPVAVIAMFKDSGVEGRLRLLVESESLFNDGVAAVLFGLVLAWAGTEHAETITVSGVLRSTLWTVGGGLVAGLAVGGLALAITGRTADHLVESILTTVSAYGSFLLAEHLHCSGVLATVAAGLLVGNFGVLAPDERSQISSKGREFVLALWEFIAFFANSLVFLLIGLTVPKIPFAWLGVFPILTVILLVLAGRALTVYPLCLLFIRSSWVIPMSMRHILWWGGLRGALGLALALSLPSALPFHDEILILTFAVVIFSVVLQGLTMPWMLRKQGFLS